MATDDAEGRNDDDGESNFLIQRRMQALALRKGVDLLGVDLENEDHKQYVYHQLGFSAVVPQQIQLLACIKQYQEAAMGRYSRLFVVYLSWCHQISDKNRFRCYGIINTTQLLGVECPKQ